MDSKCGIYIIIYLFISLFVYVCVYEKTMVKKRKALNLGGIVSWDIRNIGRRRGYYINLF